MTGVLDVKSTAGKRLLVREHTELLIVGAGPAGLSAALEAARLGMQVVLVDEHPVDPGLMGLDIPFHFGQRMSGAHRGNAAIVKLAESDPRLAEAFEAGVDVRLGVAVWGLFAHGLGQRWIEGRVAGLSDGHNVWFMRFDKAILACGRRDLGLAFPGWELPGVMGVTAADALLRRYDAFNARKCAIVGSGVEATTFAKAALQAGRDVVALIEVAEAPLDHEGCTQLAEQGVPILTGSMIARAMGGATGVERIQCIKLGTEAASTELECDTVVLAVGAVPAIDLLDVAGARIAFVAEQGGYVPLTDAEGRTSVPMLFAVGDCVGFTAAKTRDPAIAASEGARAAAAAAVAVADHWPPPPDKKEPAASDDEVSKTRMRWAAAVMTVADTETHVCQCEQVSIADLLGVQPPRYLRRNQPAMQARDITTLARDGTLNQDQVKRLTRAGMGTCQGRRCREQIGAILALATNTPLSAIPLPSYRAPVRPLPLSVLATLEEESALTENWHGWFGIEGQWVPYWELAKESDQTGSAT